MAERSSRENYIADLDPPRFFRMARQVDRMTPEQAAGFAESTLAQLNRLGAKRDLSKAVPVRYDGPVSLDLLSMIDWAKRIQKQHGRATRQLVALDAAAVKRSGLG